MNFHKAMMDAVERDLKIILDISSITPQELLDSCDFCNEIQPLELPLWKTGEPVNALRGELKD